MISREQYRVMVKYVNCNLSQIFRYSENRYLEQLHTIETAATQIHRDVGPLQFKLARSSITHNEQEEQDGHPGHTRAVCQTLSCCSSFDVTQFRQRADRLIHINKLLCRHTDPWIFGRDRALNKLRNRLKCIPYN